MKLGLPDAIKSQSLDFLKISIENHLAYCHTLPQIRVETDVYGRTINIDDRQQVLIYQLKGSEWVNVEPLPYDTKGFWEQQRRENGQNTNSSRMTYPDFVKCSVSSLNCEAVHLSTSTITDCCEYVYYTSGEVIDHFKFPFDTDDEGDAEEDPWLNVDDFLKRQGICAFHAAWTKLARLQNDIYIEDESMTLDNLLGIHRISFA